MFFRKKCRPMAVVQSEPVIEHVSFQQDNVVMIKDVPNSSIELPDRELFTLENQLKSGMSMPKVNPTVLSPFDSDAAVVVNAAVADDVVSAPIDSPVDNPVVEPSKPVSNED